MAEKKRTYEQLERALKRAQREAARNEQTRGEAVSERLDLAEECCALEDKLEAETFRADNLLSETDELNILIRADHERAQEGRALAAETNLAAFRKALEASNAVSLGLLDIVKRATALLPPPEDD